MITSVSSVEFPADLLDLKIGFLDVEAEIAAHAATLPAGADIIAGRAKISDEDRERSRALHARAADLASRISGHPFWAAMQGAARVDAMTALTRAARDARDAA